LDWYLHPGRANVRNSDRLTCLVLVPEGLRYDLVRDVSYSVVAFCCRMARRPLEQPTAALTPSTFPALSRTCAPNTLRDPTGARSSHQRRCRPWSSSSRRAAQCSLPSRRSHWRGGSPCMACSGTLSCPPSVTAATASVSTCLVPSFSPSARAPSSAS